MVTSVIFFFNCLVYQKRRLAGVCFLKKYTGVANGDRTRDKGTTNLCVTTTP